MGFGGRRLFDGGTATDSLAGSIFRSFWGVIAGAEADVGYVKASISGFEY